MTLEQRAAARASRGGATSNSIASGSSGAATALQDLLPRRVDEVDPVRRHARRGYRRGAGRRTLRVGRRAARQRGVALLAQEPLRVERGRAARAGGGDGLAVDVVLDVAGGEDARRCSSPSTCPR